ncbi:unnamed protein product, partial [Polarella glacialis]
SCGQRRLQLSLEGLLSMRVWAVVGDPLQAEEVVDHLMDCGKTVYSVSASGAEFASTAELDSNPNLPKTEVLAFINQDPACVRAALGDAVRLGVHGIVLHPDASSFGPEVVAECRAAGLGVYVTDILSEVRPGSGIAVAPLD